MKRQKALFPYDNYYIYKVFHKKEGRYYANLIPININGNNKRKTISYARYLMSVKLKRFLTSGEEVDHIDNNRTNDIIENLQVLSKSENLRKETKTIGRKYVTLECPVCHKIFDLPKNQSFVQKKSKYNCCSKKCNYTMLKITHNGRDTKVLDDMIKCNLVSEYVKYCS